jgi:pyruvate, water dikinase
VTAAGSFPLPSQIADVPGAEGWRSMYPYFTRFQPEDDNRFWFYNAMHFPEPMPSFDVVTAEIPYTAIGANTARVFCFPATLGIEHRIVNGRIYITAIPVTDPAEIEARLETFQQRAGYYYENWDRLYEGWKTRMADLIGEIEAISVPELPELDDADVVMSSTGVAQNHYVRENYHRCWTCTPGCATTTPSSSCSATGPTWCSSSSARRRSPRYPARWSRAWSRAST